MSVFTERGFKRGVWVTLRNLGGVLDRKFIAREDHTTELEVEQEIKHVIIKWDLHSGDTITVEDGESEVE